jgi:hypothetical protein
LLETKADLAALVYKGVFLSKSCVFEEPIFWFGRAENMELCLQAFSREIELEFSTHEKKICLPLNIVHMESILSITERLHTLHFGKTQSSVIHN